VAVATTPLPKRADQSMPSSTSAVRPRTDAPGGRRSVARTSTGSAPRTSARR
jgi:hypothetical protein